MYTENSSVYSTDCLHLKGHMMPSLTFSKYILQDMDEYRANYYFNENNHLYGLFHK